MGYWKDSLGDTSTTQIARKAQQVLIFLSDWNFVWIMWYIDWVLPGVEKKRGS
jgi:hypothetical protein